MGKDQPPGGLEDARGVGVERLATLLDLRHCWYEPFPFDVQLPRIEPGRILLPAAEPGLEPWSSEAGVELPVRFQGLTVGRLVLRPGRTSDRVARPLRVRRSRLPGRLPPLPLRQSRCAEGRKFFADRAGPAIQSKFSHLQLAQQLHPQGRRGAGHGADLRHADGAQW